MVCPPPAAAPEASWGWREGIEARIISYGLAVLPVIVPDLLPPALPNGIEGMQKPAWH